MRRFTWLHLSDWHQGKEDFDRTVVAEALIKDLAGRVEWAPEAESIDAVFFTGDLAFRGIASEFELAAQNFLTPVLDLLGLGKNRLFLVPGNHDLDRNRFRLLPQDLRQPLASNSAVNEWFADEESREELIKPFRDYDKFVSKYGANGFSSLADNRILEINGSRIGIVGINSALMCGRPDQFDQYNDLNKLVVGEPQILRVFDEVSDCDLQVALIHHPFEWMASFDRSLTKPRIQRAADFLLFGHEHEPDFRQEVGHQTGIAMVPAGAAFERRVAENPIYANGYNVVSVDLDSGKCSIFMRRWASHNLGWKRDDEFGTDGVHRFQIARLAKQKENRAVPTVSSAPMVVPDLAAAERTYLEYVVRANQYLNPAGIAQTQTSVTLPLNEVYVSLDAIRDDSGRIILDPREDDTRLDSPVSESGDHADDPDEEAVARSRHRPEAAPVRVELPTAVLSSFRMVILGDPGAGKTTLTRFLAGLHARELLKQEEYVRDDFGNEYGTALLPVRVRAARFAEAKGLSFGDFVEQEVIASGLERSVANRMIAERLCVGEILIIVDGLDEAGDRAARARVVEALTQYLHGPGNLAHIVVTSRISGFAEVQLPGDFDRYTMREMDREQIGRFLSRWCSAVERFHQRQATDAEIQKSAQEQIEKLVNAVDENVGVRRLAANPLLLTILALIQKNGGRLPRRRVELYRQAAQTLLRDWRAAQSGAESMEISETEEDELLVPLAYHMHQDYPSGEIPHADARRFLIEELSRQRGVKSAGIPAAVDDFLDRIRRHAGVLAERSPGKYAFLHLTFEEYFAGKALVADPVAAVDRIRAIRHRARWEEPIRLGIAMQNAALSTILIRAAILGHVVDGYSCTKNESEHEVHLHRDFLLSVRCYGDTVGVSLDFRQELVTRLLNLVFGRNPHIANLAQMESSIFVGTNAEAEWIGVLLSRLEDTEASVRQIAAFALGTLGVTNTLVTNGLLAKLDDSGSGVRAAAAIALGTLGIKSQIVTAALVAKLDDTDSDVRESVALALGRLGAMDNEVITALIARLGDTYHNVRLAAVTALGTLGITSETVVMALVARLKDEVSDVRQVAAIMLGKLEVSNEAVVAGLIDRLEDRYHSVRQSSAHSLHKLGVESSLVVKSLITRLGVRDIWVRRSAVIALGTMGVQSEGVVEAITTKLQERNWQIRESASIALGRLGVQSDEVVAALISRLKDKSEYVRRSTVSALGTLGVKSDIVLASLIKLLDDDSENVRRAVVDALGTLGGENYLVVRALIDTSEDESTDVRVATSIALGLTRNPSEAVVNTLIRLQEDKYSHVREAASIAVGMLGIKSEAAVTALLRLLGDESVEVRWSAVQILGDLSVNRTSVISALKARLDDDDAAIRGSAASSLYQLISEA